MSDREGMLTNRLPEPSESVLLVFSRALQDFPAVQGADTSQLRSRTSSVNRIIRKATLSSLDS